MKTFSELMELFDKEHEFTHTVNQLSDRTSEHRYEFDHKGRKFQAIIHHDKKTGESEVAFGDEYTRMGKTGESGHRSVDVFSKMASIIRHHAKTTPTAKEISFTSRKEDGDKVEGSRSKLYRKFTSRLGGKTEDFGTKHVYHTIPADRITEETREQKFARLRSDAAAFGKEIDAKRAPVSVPPPAAKQPVQDKPAGPHPGSFQNNPTNYSRKDFKNAAVSKEKWQTRDAPGNDELAAKTYAALGIKRKDQSRVPQEQPAPNKPAAEPAKVQRPFPDKAPEKQFGQDTKMGLLKLNRKIDSDTSTANKPAPKVGSLVNKQSGYPAAKPAPTVAAKPDVPQKGYPAAKQPAPPKPTARPDNLVKKQSFGQAFAAAKKAGLKKFSYDGREYNTRVK